jgi:glycine cleavage system H protein
VLPDLKYASSHEWAKPQGESATVGISDHAQVRLDHAFVSRQPRDHADTHNLPLQGELGDVVYVELPEVGSTVTKGETFGVVESVKVCGLLLVLLRPD